MEHNAVLFSGRTLVIKVFYKHSKPENILEHIGRAAKGPMLRMTAITLNSPLFEGSLIDQIPTCEHSHNDPPWMSMVIVNTDEDAEEVLVRLKKEMKTHVCSAVYEVEEVGGSFGIELWKTLFLKKSKEEVN